MIPAESADDEGTRKAIEDVIAVVGPVADRSGKPGVDGPRVDAFFTEAQSLADWCEYAQPNRSL